MELSWEGLLVSPSGTFSAGYRARFVCVIFGSFVLKLSRWARTRMRMYVLLLNAMPEISLFVQVPCKETVVTAVRREVDMQISARIFTGVHYLPP